MPLRKDRSGMNRYSTKPLAAIVGSFLLHWPVFSSLAVKGAVSSQQEWAHPIRDPHLLSGSKPHLTGNFTMMQEPFYVKNTYLRSNLRDDQTGVSLSLSISVLDVNSGAPVENALVEIWGANRQGIFSGFSNTNGSHFDCSAWLRGGLETDSDGIAKFETLYPGQEPNRTLHLHAIVRTDWFEHSKNKTVDSDSTQFAAAVGQIFFSNELNGQILQRSEYQRPSIPSIKNEADPLYRATTGSWKANLDLNGVDLNAGVRAHVTITVDSKADQKFAIHSSPYQCKSDAAEVNNPTAPLSQSQPSAAAMSQPSLLLLALCCLTVLYNMYQSNNFHTERRPLTITREPREELL